MYFCLSNTLVSYPISFDISTENNLLFLIFCEPSKTSSFPFQAKKMSTSIFLQSMCPFRLCYPMAFSSVFSLFQWFSVVSISIFFFCTFPLLLLYACTVTSNFIFCDSLPFLVYFSICFTPLFLYSFVFYMDMLWGSTLMFRWTVPLFLSYFLYSFISLFVSSLYPPKLHLSTHFLKFIYIFCKFFLFRQIFAIFSML